jgi:NAD(P)-dependent dehydrogenase (short-subunit alcohol dehydrogenase family)
MSITAETHVADRPKAVVIGVGPEQGLGAGLSRRFAAEGGHVIVAGRTEAKLELLASTRLFSPPLPESAATACAHVCEPPSSRHFHFAHRRARTAIV